MPFLGSPIQTPPRVVIFDIGRVIIGVDLARSFGTFGASTGLSPEQVWTALRSDSRWEDWQEGRMTPRDWHRHLCEKFQCSLGFEQFCKIWNRVLDPETILPDRLFERLAASCRLGLLSNTDTIHVAHIEATFPFVRHFPARIYSCRVGTTKPKPLIYRHALCDMDASPEEAMFIDDLRENAATAAGLGMAGFHFTSAGELLAEFSRLGMWTV